MMMLQENFRTPRNGFMSNPHLNLNRLGKHIPQTHRPLPSKEAGSSADQETVRIRQSFLQYTSTPDNSPELPNPDQRASIPRAKAILIVDDEPAIRSVVRMAVGPFAENIIEADNGYDALDLIAKQPFDAVLLDIGLPKFSGLDVLRQVRSSSASPHMKVLMLSGHGDGDYLSNTLAAGADDFLVKPCTVTQLRARLAAALRLKAAQDHTDQLSKRLARVNAEMELALTARDGELLHARSAMVLALCDLVGQRSRETGSHLVRIQKYCRVLGEAALKTPAYANRLSTDMMQTIEAASPLHDIGKVAIPDGVLNKPGTLTVDERTLMQTHAVAGAETLARVTQQYLFASAFFHTAIEIARHHHEKWDGTGYPDRLSGEMIPLAARLVAIADVYDALRSRRVYKAGDTHEMAVHRMTHESPGHFDPVLLQVFVEIAPEFATIFDSYTD